MFSISILAVIVAAVANFILGFLFHGPIFGKLWMKLADIHPTGNEKLSDMYGQMFSNLIVNIVTAAVLAVLANAFLASGLISSVTMLCASLAAGLAIWIVALTSSSIEVIWMGRKIAFWAFEGACSLICIFAMSVIIAYL